MQRERIPRPRSLRSPIMARGPDFPSSASASLQGSVRSSIAGAGSDHASDLARAGPIAYARERCGRGVEAQGSAETAPEDLFQDTRTKPLLARFPAKAGDTKVAEPTELSFELHEVTAALLTSAGITSGKWALSFEFAVSTGPVGPPENSKPGTMTRINRVQLKKATDDTALDPSIVDASMLKAVGGLASI